MLLISGKRYKVKKNPGITNHKFLNINSFRDVSVLVIINEGVKIFDLFSLTG